MESNIQPSNKRKRDYVDQANKGDEFFLDILIGVLNKDKRCDEDQFKSHILKRTMEKMEEDISEKFPDRKLEFKAHIEWIMRRVRTTYEIVYDMKNQSGFGWDDEKKMIKVETDEVWNEYVKRNPRAKHYRNTPIPLFDKLARVFGKDHASGKELANSSANVEMINKQEEEQNDPACGEELADPSANIEMIDDKQEAGQNDVSNGQELAHQSAIVEVIDDKQEKEQNDPACGKELANLSVNVEIIDDKQEVEQNDPANGQELAHNSANVEVIDDKQEEEQNDSSSCKELANLSVNVEIIDDKQEEQNNPANGQELAHNSANVEVIDEQKEEQNDSSSGKKPANPSANVEMIDKQEEEQNDPTSGTEPAHSSANVEMIDKQEDQNDPTSGKEPVNPSASVEMIDKQEEEQNDSEEDEVEMTLLTPRNHGCMEGSSKKRNGEENAIANSILEFEKTIKGLLEKQIEQLGAVVNRLGADKDIYDDSRKVMSELTKMGLTEQQYFTAADRILSVPHRLHIFWGCNDVNRLAFVKSLI